MDENKVEITELAGGLGDDRKEEINEEKEETEGKE